MCSQAPPKLGPPNIIHIHINGLHMDITAFCPPSHPKKKRKKKQERERERKEGTICTILSCPFHPNKISVKKLSMLQPLLDNCCYLLIAMITDLAPSAQDVYHKAIWQFHNPTASSCYDSFILF